MCGAGGAAGSADPTEYGAAGQLLAEAHLGFRQVTEHADKALAVVDEHRIAVEEVVADQRHLAGGWGLDRCAGGHGKVQARMWVALFAIEEAAHAEAAGQRAVDRFVEQQVARRGGAELLVGAGLLGQFALDAFEVAGVRVDHLGVFQGDALLGVLLAGDRETQLAASAVELLQAGFERQRQADDTDPARLVLFHHQHRFTLKARAGCSGARPQFDHCDAARYRVVEQAGEKALGVGGQGEAEQQCDQRAQAVGS